MTTKVTPKDGQIQSFRPLQNNPNAHTQRGLGMLAASVQEDGWVAPLTVAADGESLDGAARLEVASDKFGDDVLVVEHDGTRPIVMVRTDIPDASVPIAKRIIYRANRVAEVNLSWDAQQIVADLDAELDLSGMFYEEELLGILDKVASAVPDLDDLTTQYGEPQERDFWPFIRIQVSPDTLDYFDSLMQKAPGVDEAAKVQTLLEAVDVSLFDAGLS